jgi:hypothetical protein
MMIMDKTEKTDLRRRSILMRGVAELRLVTLADGPAAGARIVEVRTPHGLTADVALDRGGDLFRLGWRGVDIGWRSAADGATPWPVADTEEGLGFLRGFDGFLVTCGLDHHGVAAATSAQAFNYPLRKHIHHPLHGRIMSSRAELVEKRIDWDAGEMRLRLILRQASVFGEVLELDRLWTFHLDRPEVRLTDRVINRGFRPTRHGVLYHVNFGHPFLGEDLRLSAPDWPPAAKLAGDIIRPTDDHVEMVDAAPSPQDGRVELTNRARGFGLAIAFDSQALPVTALWRAFQSGTFALGVEPQTSFADAAVATLAPQEERMYRLSLTILDAPKA